MNVLIGVNVHAEIVFIFVLWLKKWIKTILSKGILVPTKFEWISDYHGLSLIYMIGIDYDFVLLGFLVLHHSTTPFLVITSFCRKLDFFYFS